MIARSEQLSNQAVAVAFIPAILLPNAAVFIFFFILPSRVMCIVRYVVCERAFVCERAECVRSQCSRRDHVSDFTLSRRTTFDSYTGTINSTDCTTVHSFFFFYSHSSMLFHRNENTYKMKNENKTELFHKFWREIYVCTCMCVCACAMRARLNTKLLI